VAHMTETGWPMYTAINQAVKHFVFCTVYNQPKHTPDKAVRKAKNDTGTFPKSNTGIWKKGNIPIHQYSNL